MFSSTNNSVSISVSGDEPNDLNWIRPTRTRRKRKKPGHRTSFELPRYFLRLFLRCWILLVFLLAVGLLLFKSTRIGTKSANSELSELKRFQTLCLGNRWDNMSIAYVENKRRLHSL